MEFKFRIEREYKTKTKSEAIEMFIEDIANNNFDIEEATETFIEDITTDTFGSD